MIGIVLVTHCQLGAAFLDSAEFVLGSPVEKALSVSIDLKQPAAVLRKDIQNGIRSVDSGDGVLLLTDMFGGTPSNLGYSFLEENQVEVISGVNLPTLLRAASLRETRDLGPLAREVEDYGKKSICLASVFLKGNKKSAS